MLVFSMLRYGFFTVKEELSSFREVNMDKQKYEPLHI